MSYISEIFERANIQSLREYLLHGVEPLEIDTGSYKERIDNAWKEINSVLHHQFPDEKTYEHISGQLFHYETACENVYMEIGLQCGFSLAMEFITGEGIKKS